MRLNQFIARATGLSRRQADAAIANGRVMINSQTATLGQIPSASDSVTLDGKPISLPHETTTLILNKPVGYVCSRDGQGSQTVYALLPEQYHGLKPVGRLDKDSSGLLLLTDDGDLANRLTHPSYQKQKRYQIRLNEHLTPLHRQMIEDNGLQLKDGLSRLGLERVNEQDDTQWYVTMHEGRNRQIRRTFAALGYKVEVLQRLQFGSYELGNLKSGSFEIVNT